MSCATFIKLSYKIIIINKIVIIKKFIMSKMV